MAYKHYNSDSDDECNYEYKRIKYNEIETPVFIPKKIKWYYQTEIIDYINDDIINEIPKKIMNYFYTNDLLIQINQSPVFYGKFYYDIIITDNKNTNNYCDNFHAYLDCTNNDINIIINQDIINMKLIKPILND